MEIRKVEVYILHPFLLLFFSPPSLEWQVMNNKPYSHKEKPLTWQIAKEIISNRIATHVNGSSVQSIAKKVREIHEEQGGLPAEEDLKEIVNQGLRYLSMYGKANQVSSDIWTVPQYPDQEIFGSGKHWVYLYYFSADKKKAKSDSMSPYDDEDDLFWPCKIGKTDKDPEDRVKALTRGVPVPPRIGLLLRTDEHSALEDAIHGILTVRGRHLKELQGKEWFLTNPREVTKIYDFIIRLNPYLGL